MEQRKTFLKKNKKEMRTKKTYVYEHRPNHEFCNAKATHYNI